MTVPGNLSSPLLATAAAAAAGDVATKSLRFNSGDTAYLSRTPSAASNRRTFTVSFWIKKVKNDSSANFYRIFGQAEATHLYFYQDNLHFDISTTTAGSAIGRRWTNQVFRDNSAFFHCVASCDTTAATASERMRLYINGVEVESFGTTLNPSQNADTSINTTNEHTIGYRTSAQNSAGGALDAYIADFYFIDGSALDATSFGAFDDNGVWQAAAYSGTFGTNGFHLLDFANESTVGHDSSGNENDFTANNIGTGGNGDYISELNNVNDFYGNGRATWGPTLFNGATGDKGPIPAAGTPMTYTPSSSITLTGTGLRIWVARKAGGIFINGNSVSATDQQWNDYGTTYSPLTSIEWRTTDGSNFSQLSAIEINGTQLIDNSVTAVAAGNDVLFDVPTNGTQSDTGAGGEVSGNYCTWNPLAEQKSDSITLSNGNLTATVGSTRSSFFGTMALEGKTYWEIVFTGGAYVFGMADASMFNTTANTAPNRFIGETSTSWSIGNDGTVYNNGASQGSETSWTNGDVMGWSYDSSNGAIKIYKNGTLNGSYTASTANTYFPAATLLTSGASVDVNFGQRAFAYSAPSGFSPLCTTLLSTPTIADSSAQFETVLWDGDSASPRSITGLGFSPDIVYMRPRNYARNNTFYDTVRGAGKKLYSDGNDAEDSGTGRGYLSSFDSAGFTLTDGSAGDQDTNNSSYNYVAWCWNAGANSNKTYTVKVVSDSGNKYRFDDHGTSAVTLDLAEGSTYIFDQSDSSNAGHPIRFGTSANGTDYTTGVTHTGTPGSAGAKTTLVLGTGVSTLYYSCANHSGMGGQINTNSTAGSTRLSGSENASAYDQSATWSNATTLSGGSTASGKPLTNGFDGSTSTLAEGDSANEYAEIAISATIPAGGVRVYAAVTSSNQLAINLYNGSSEVESITQGTSGGKWYSTSSYAGPITKIRVERIGRAWEFNAIEVNGKILVDSNVTPATPVPSINSVVKANPEAGFSICTFTSPSSGTFSFGHGLNAAPELVLVKTRGATSDWSVYHASVVDTTSKYLVLNSTAALATYSTIWGSALPTSSVVGLTSGGAVATSQTCVAYCFSSVSKYSSFGSYEGNGSSDGPFVALSFRPALIILKNIDATADWKIYDSSRDPDNAVDSQLYPSASYAESDGDRMDFLSNGFKLRTSGGEDNASGNTYVYYAVAENPFSSNGGLAR